MVKRKGIKHYSENTARISTETRGDDGLGVNRVVISETIKRNAPISIFRMIAIVAGNRIHKKQSKSCCYIDYSSRIGKINPYLTKGKGG